MIKINGPSPVARRSRRPACRGARALDAVWLSSGRACPLHSWARRQAQGSGEVLWLRPAVRRVIGPSTKAIVSSHSRGTGETGQPRRRSGRTRGCAARPQDAPPSCRGPEAALPTASHRRTDMEMLTALWHAMNASVVAAYRIPSLDHSGQRCLARPPLHLHLSPPRPRVSHRRSLSVVADALGVLALDGVRRPAETGKYGTPSSGLRRAVIQRSRHPPGGSHKLLSYNLRQSRSREPCGTNHVPDDSGHEKNASGTGGTCWGPDLASMPLSHRRRALFVGSRGLASKCAARRSTSRPGLLLPPSPFPPPSVALVRAPTGGTERAEALLAPRFLLTIGMASGARPWDRRCSLDWPWRPWPGPGEIYSWQPPFTPSALRRAVPCSRRATEVGPVRSS